MDMTVEQIQLINDRILELELECDDTNEILPAIVLEFQLKAIDGIWSLAYDEMVGYLCAYFNLPLVY